jgi:GAF domain-containing protein
MTLAASRSDTETAAVALAHRRLRRRRRRARGPGPARRGRRERGLHAASSGELTESADAQSETRWADYCRRAAERGALASLSVPLPVSEQIAGALNVYAREANAFDDSSRSTATKFAPYAAVAIANMHAYDSARNMADNLELALEHRAVIDQAKGMLMERYKLTPDQAFQARSSRSSRPSEPRDSAAMCQAFR